MMKFDERTLGHTRNREILSKSESRWNEIGRPYYNIHPSLAKKMTKTNLAKIPSKLIETPHGYSVVNIRFSTSFREMLKLDENINTQTVNSSGYVTGAMLKAGIPIRQVMIADHREYAEGMFIIVDWGFTSSKTHPTLSYFGLKTTDLSIEEEIENSASVIAQGYITLGNEYRKILTQVLRIVVTAGFLINSNPELIDYDILAKYRHEFVNSKDEKRKKFILEKSKEKRGKGFNVGNDLMFLGSKNTQDNKNYEPTGKELQFAHIRGGHPHAVRYGEGKEKVKIMWFRSTTVRPDLPFNDE